MSDFLAFQEFTPTEEIAGGPCIWCGLDMLKNRAHIISKKLVSTGSNTPILSGSVCEKCNSACGRVEQWILRNTPLAWIRHFLYTSANRDAQVPRTPAYYYASNLREWVVYHLDSANRRYCVPTQLLLNETGLLQLITNEPPAAQTCVTNSLLDKLKAGKLLKDIKPTLPTDFSPRLIVDDEEVILIAKCEADCRSFCRAAQQSLSQASAKRTRLGNTGEERQHFRWSKDNWVKFCAKVCYETLCLFEGRERCLRPCFAQLRQYVLSGPSKKSREILFNEHGPIRDKDIPDLVHADLSVGQNCPEYFPAILSHADRGMHSIMIYESEGWICASVSFAGFPPSALILGGPDEHLQDVYSVVYDEHENKFLYTRLAFDRTKPIIPMAIAGNLSALAKTNKLRPI